MRALPLVLITLAACSSVAPDPTQPTAPAAPGYATVRGAWTTDSQPSAWAALQITQASGAIVVSSTVWTRSSSVWARYGTFADTGAITGDSVALTGHEFTAGALHNDTLYLTTSGVYNLVTGTLAFVPGTAVPGDTIAPTSTASDTLLAGIWVSDSVDWQVSNPSCVGIIQVALLMGIPADPQGKLYQGATYVRICGTTTFTAFTSNMGYELADSTLLWGQVDPPLAGVAGENWQLRVAALDTLADITPDSINLGWKPPRFYRVDTLPGLPSFHPNQQSKTLRRR